MPRKSWWARLPFGVRMAAGTGAFLVLVGGGAAGVATLTSPASGETVASTPQVDTGPDLGAPRLEEDPEVVSRAAAAAEPPLPRHEEKPAPPVPVRAATTDQLSRARVADERADRTGPRPARTADKPSGEARRRAVAAPMVTTRTDVETRVIPFDTRVVRDASLPRGTRRVQAPGVPGEQALRYLVTVTDGRPTARRLLGASVTKAPQERVVALGARRKSALDPACEQALNICLPLGRSAVCPADGSEFPVTVLDPAEVDAREQEVGEILIAEEDLELLDGVRLEPATLC
ncbi:G5 domain-containing protein [Actinoplanes sp. NEAU-A12]|uniref:G5 domain-containing protein n=1 Tax=Actinoplanes sandaracinus TaxID=3045177 RepID=A0ABT6WIY4_9ACTN|nr:G5 domain-containing protein [Actinoplanes sandaracinus]MDI6099696.1 G5 domain-containing protein [Actinoplanes sandaracinus]